MSVKISQLPSASAVTSDDLFAIVDDPSGTPVTKKITAEKVLEFITSSITQLPNLILESGTIGPAEDGSYTDGLFTSFVPSTPIGTAIDKINEVLKGLAPPAAPELTNLEKEGSVGNPMRLSFGTTSPNVGFTSVSASLPDLPNVDIGGTFQPLAAPGGGSKRLGVFKTTQSLALALNNTTVADAAAFINYPNDSFNVSEDGVGQYILEVNGTIVDTSNTSNTASFSNPRFDLSPANPGAFTGTGISFDLFRNRTGTVSIDSADWIAGHNYVKVSHSSSLGLTTTNYVDWVYDPDLNDEDLPYIFNNVTASAFTINGTKFLSGVKYFTNVTYDFTTNVVNYFKSSYSVASNGGVTFTTNPASPDMNAAPINVGTPANSDVDLLVTSSQTIGNIRLLGETLSTTININNTMDKTGTATFTTPTILLDKINTANNDTTENFCLENYRLPSASYDTQLEVLSSEVFPSSIPLSSDGLAVYGGAVRYPTQLLNGGNIEGSSVVFKIAGQPNYSSATGERNYFRKFVNGDNSLAVFNLNITGKNITFVPSSETLNLNEVKLFIKVPGTTGWRDVNTSAGEPSGDDIGCLQGDLALPIGATQATRTIQINLLTESIEPEQFYLLRIEASDGWTGYINKVEIT